MSKVYLPMGPGSNRSNRGSDAMKKYEAIRKYRKEASRLAAMANKRVDRLSTSEFIDSPAYQKWLAEGGEKFSIRGKDYNQVQKEVARIRNFINSNTSTITGIKKHLQEMAKNTGIKYNSMQELKSLAPKFFELASKVEQYLRTVDDMASAIGYQKIWEAINQYTQDQDIDLSQTEQSVDSMVAAVTRALNEFETPLTAGGQSVFVKIYGPDNQ